MTIAIVTPKHGTAGNDHLYAEDQGDFICGDGGDDIIESGLRGDVIYGDALFQGAHGEASTGSDTISYVRSNAAVQVDLTAAEQHGGYAEGDHLYSIENVIGSYYNDTISGDGGDNRLEGGAGADVLDGRGGTDTAIYASAPSSMTITLGEGTADGSANVDNVVMTEWIFGRPFTYTVHNVPEDTLRSIENIVGTSYDDHITGNSGINDLDGGPGKDTIDGGAGDDKLHGGGNDDTILGGPGADFNDGGKGTDTVDYSNSPDFVWASLMPNSGLPGFNAWAQGDTFNLVENLIGSAYDDRLTGSDVVNHLDGNGGDDHIEGRGGADVLDGGSGVNWLEYYSSPIGVTVDLGTQTASGGDADGDQFKNFQNVVGAKSFDNILTGSKDDNVIWGGDHNDVLKGLDGDDTLFGQKGDDTMTGGKGSDTFLFFASSVGNGIGKDHITDYEIGVDHVMLHDFSPEQLRFEQAGDDTILTFAGLPGAIVFDHVNMVTLQQHVQTDFIFT